MYVWFNLAGMWDPYNNVDNLEVAIVNNDQGYKSDVIPVDLQLGNSVVSALHENQGLKWAFTDFDDAMNKLIDGKYYAIIVIPEDFSNQLLSIASGQVESANLVYYSNEKNNPIAPKITDKGASAIQQSINKTFSKSIYTVLLNTISDILNSGSSDEAASYGNNIVSLLMVASSSIDNVKSEIFMMKDNLSSLNSTLLRIKSNIPASSSEINSEIYAKLDQVQNDVLTALDSMNEVQNILSYFGKRSELIDKFINLLNDVNSAVNNCKNIVNESQEASDRFVSTIDSVISLVREASFQLDSLQDTLNIISNDINQSKDYIMTVSSSDSIDQVKNLIGTDSDKFATLITSPVQLERNAVFPMVNNAASMSGFYIAICV